MSAPWAIDVVVNPFTPEIVGSRPAWTASFIGGKIGARQVVAGVSTEEYLAKMDRAGIERSFLVAAKLGPASDERSFQLEVETVAQIVASRPDRFSGLVGLDPTAGMAELRHLERAVRELGFVGAHSYPHWFGIAPDDRRYYPIYARCCELDVPIQLQVGHCLRYDDARPLRSVGRPLTLDTVACDLPELKLVGIHTGWPWTEEMIAVAYKHPNVYIGIDAYAPRYLDPALVHFANTFGRGKVLFGTDFPVIDPERGVREVAELGLKEESHRALMRDAAAALYRL
ncbi:MAG TPA: amidohydrolase family protein [Cellulomonas sp.]